MGKQVGMRTEDFPFSHLTTDRMSHQPTNWVKVWGRSWLHPKFPHLTHLNERTVTLLISPSLLLGNDFFTILSTPTPEGKCSISGCFFTPGDFLLHPHIRDLEGSRREIRNPPRDLVNTHNKHASQHEILVSRLSAKGGEAK